MSLCVTACRHRGHGASCVIVCVCLQAQKPWGKLSHGAGCVIVYDCLQAQKPWGKLSHEAGCVVVCDCLQALKQWGRLCHCVHLPAGTETMGQAAAEGAGCKERVPHCMSHREKYSQPGKQCSRGCLCVTRQCESLQLFFYPSLHPVTPARLLWWW